MKKFRNEWAVTLINNLTFLQEELEAYKAEELNLEETYEEVKVTLKNLLDLSNKVNEEDAKTSENRVNREIGYVLYKVIRELYVEIFKEETFDEVIKEIDEEINRRDEVTIEFIRMEITVMFSSIKPMNRNRTKALS